MSNDLISRKAAVELVIAEYDRFQANGGSHSGRYELDKVIKMLRTMPTAFDKEKVIEELKSWEKASHDAGIQSTYAELDNKASGYYQESRAYHRAIEIVEKGGIE